jgi:hypothetical protein
LRSNYKGHFDNNNEGIYLRGKFGHFKSYLPAYQTWQRNGIGEISKKLKENKKVIAVTTDLKKFYHRINPSFLVDPIFLNYVGVKLDPDQLKLTNILIAAMREWSMNVYFDSNVPIDFKFNQHCGIPMGLGASKTIANLLLIHLDRQVEQEIKPIYYGRYVDDIFLVLEDGENISNSIEFWAFLKKRIETLGPNKLFNNKNDNNEVEYQPSGYILEVPYAPESLIEFSSDKEKYFFLEGVSGESFLDTVKQSLDENSSEWNLPPDIQNDLESFTEEVSKATTNNEEAANGLRKSDGLSIQRLKFVLYLKRLEVIVNYFPDKNWREKVNHFFNLCLEHAVTPETIVTYSKYYPRIVSLAVNVGNFEFIRNFSKKIDFAFNKLKSYKVVNNVALMNAKFYIDLIIEEAILYTIDPDSIRWINDIRILFRTKKRSESIRETVRRIIVTDLHKKSFKDYFIYPFIDFPEYLQTHQFEYADEINYNLKNLPGYNDFEKFSSYIFNKAYPNDNLREFKPFAFYFFIRPFSLFDLSLVFPKWTDFKDEFYRYCSLFKIDILKPENCSPGFDIPENIKSVCLNTYESELNRTIAFTSLEIKNDSWIAVVQQHPIEPDATRFQRLFSLIRNIFQSNEKKIHYVLFPELSIPKKLLSYISYLFLKKKISIIAGVEYEETNKHLSKTQFGIPRFVTNQLFFILTIKGKWGAEHIVLQQEKVIPAQGEERELFNVGGAMLSPLSTYKYLINHGGFWFAGLICNDFLDIKNRAIFRGLVDALVIVEWNKDIETYNALVESSANDLHAFIMQVNNRQYGDTRLRAPFKESFERDVVRVRGGELDYFVIATLKVKELRAFQRYYRSPALPFKPVPTGYIMSPYRKNNGI